LVPSVKAETLRRHNVRHARWFGFIRVEDVINGLVWRRAPANLRQTSTLRCAHSLQRGPNRA
jgi:hypothetical protein